MSENATPSGLSTDPALPEHTLLALRRTPEEWEEQRRQTRKSSKEFDRTGAGAALFVSMVVLFATDDPAVAIGVFVLMAVVGKGGTSIWLSRREGLPERLLQENAERCVDPRTCTRESATCWCGPSVRSRASWARPCTRGASSTTGRRRRWC